jgi:hypothetical protein
MTMKVAVMAGLVATLTSVGAGALVWRFGYYAAPYAWTDEPARLVSALGIGPGAVVADVGAGDGALAVAVARRLGGGARVYATERPDRLDAWTRSRAGSPRTGPAPCSPSPPASSTPA